MRISSEPWRLPDQASVPRPPAQGGWLVGRVTEAMPPVCRHVEAQGLIVRKLDDSDVALFKRAEKLIELVPSLATVVESLVYEIHLLAAEPGYDVSHSEPHWCSKIFVSIPERSDEVGALRLAEAVVHEAMHLELTNFEAQRPIVADLQGIMSSPWKRDLRPFGGIAHGLFVFTCLRAFFDKLICRSTNLGSAHIRSRINEIRADTASIKLTELCPGLTQLGTKLVVAWRECATAEP